MKKTLLFLITIVLDKMQDTDFNSDSLAVEMSISRIGLHRKIKALTGQSTGEFIRNIRLKRACELLGGKELNISEVCIRLDLILLLILRPALLNCIKLLLQSIRKIRFKTTFIPALIM